MHKDARGYWAEDNELSITTPERHEPSLIDEDERNERKGVMQGGEPDCEDEDYRAETMTMLYETKFSALFHNLRGQTKLEASGVEFVNGSFFTIFDKSAPHTPHLPYPQPHCTCPGSIQRGQRQPMQQVPCAFTHPLPTSNTHRRRPTNVRSHINTCAGGRSRVFEKLSILEASAVQKGHHPLPSIPSPREQAVRTCDHC